MVVHRVVSPEVIIGPEKTICHLAFKTQVKEILCSSHINKMFELNLTDRAQEQVLSYDDRVFMKKIKEGIHQSSDGHYEIPLPFKEDVIKLASNKKLALNRLRKLKQDSKYEMDQLKFMDVLIRNGYAKEVPYKELKLDNRCIWYLPHHGV